MRIGIETRKQYRKKIERRGRRTSLAVLTAISNGQERCNDNRDVLNNKVQYFPSSMKRQKPQNGPADRRIDPLIKLLRCTVKTISLGKKRTFVHDEHREKRVRWERQKIKTEDIVSLTLSLSRVFHLLVQISRNAFRFLFPISSQSSPGSPL